MQELHHDKNQIIHDQNQIIDEVRGHKRKLSAVEEKVVQLEADAAESKAQVLDMFVSMDKKLAELMIHQVSQLGQACRTKAATGLG